MESYRDKLRAFGLALTVHVVCVLVMLIGLWWTTESRPVSMPGPIIQVDLIGPTAAPRSVSVASVKAPPKPPLPKPEPPKPDVPKPEPPKVAPTPEAPSPTEVERQDQIERERVAALAEQKAEAQKEQEERHHQEQVLLEEKQRQQEEARQKQLADVRKQREAAEKALKLEKEKLAQLEDRQRMQRDKAQRENVQQEVEQEAERPQTGAGGQDNDLAARYAAAIQSAVTNNWNRPDNASPGLRCSLNIVQIPGGDVISVTVASPCNADPVTRNSIEQAVMKAAPLPYQGYEKVFQRSIRFNFRYDG